MEFIDETTLRVRSGAGGDGAIRFRRERNVPLGGPSGGDGGRGGSVRLVASRNLDTLLPVDRIREAAARDGGPGGASRRSGADAEDVVIGVPVGTVVHGRDPGRPWRPLADLARDGDAVVVAAGGAGGKGNRHFASATRRSPARRTRGEPGQERWLRLELRLIADIGLLGFPNAGKSTLLSRLSAARPKVADYPFTTLAPQLGIVGDESGLRQFTLADMPGIIEGAADGAGMGLEFLRHVERCRLLLHLVDLAPLEPPSPLGRARAINRELARHSPALAARPQVVVGNKTDLPGAERARAGLERRLGVPVLGVSAATGAGLPELRRALFARLALERGPGEP